MIVNHMLDFDAASAFGGIGDGAREVFDRDVAAQTGVENFAIVLERKTRGRDKTRAMKIATTPPSMLRF